MLTLIAPGHTSGPLTMSSREIAELTGKRHDNVMVDIRGMLTVLYDEDDALKFQGVYRGGNGQVRYCFNLPKRETLILVSGYSVELRARIIDRWQELEMAQQEPQAPAVPQTLPEALRLAADLADRVGQLSERVEQQAQQITAAEPKVQAFDRFMDDEGLFGIREAARMT